jgi:hypothetical protein
MAALKRPEITLLASAHACFTTDRLGPRCPDDQPVPGSRLAFHHALGVWALFWNMDDRAAAIMEVTFAAVGTEGER